MLNNLKCPFVIVRLHINFANGLNNKSQASKIIASKKRSNKRQQQQQRGHYPQHMCANLTYRAYSNAFNEYD